MQIVESSNEKAALCLIKNLNGQRNGFFVGPPGLEPGTY